jgi:tRNA(Ile)-lysidine synthase
MSLLNTFIDHIESENLFTKNDHLIVAVSGGVDSVVLCELCSQAGFYFEIAHCNFQLRGKESHRDETFVQSLGGKYETKVFIKKFDTEKYAAENKFSIQVAARVLRYAWFDELITSRRDPEPSTLNLQPSTLNLEPLNLHPATFLLTAHHAGDSVETLLMNFFKGTGIRGMLGIQSRHETRRSIIRPLLFAKKEDILDFAKENNLSFVVDSSNVSDKYTRNYFRNQLIPSIQKVFPRVEENLLNNIERFKETETLYQQAIGVHKKRLLKYEGSEVHIPVLKLLKTEPLKTVVYEVIKDFAFSARQTEEVLHLLKSESGKYIASPTHRIIKNRKWMIIAPHSHPEASLIVIREGDKEIEFKGGKLRIKKYSANGQPYPGKDTAMLDAKGIRFPLILRKWKQGDYFYPLGMQKVPSGRPGKKKLSRFFIDEKMSLSEKEQAWVIESEKRIMWIVGKRIDDRFKITEKTKDILELSLC